jgi:DNA polymerase-1
MFPGSGIGVKTAAALINTYGDLETLLARPAEIKHQSCQSLIENEKQARLSRLVSSTTKLRSACPLSALAVKPLGRNFCLSCARWSSARWRRA